MAVKTNIDDIEIGVDNTTNGVNSSDFIETEYDSSQIHTEENVEEIERKKLMKTNIYSFITTGIINTVPIIIDSIKQKKTTGVTKVSKNSIIKLVSSLVVPAISVIDSTVLNNKIDNTLKTKVGFRLSDVRNVVNIVQSYPSTHNVITNYVTNIKEQSKGHPTVELLPVVKRDAIVTNLTTIAPYIVDKFTDSNLTFVEKCSAVIPIKIFGGLVKRFVSTNPKLQAGYNVLTSAVNVVDFTNKTMGSAVRSNNSGIKSNVSSTVGSAVDLIHDMLGQNRGNISRYGMGGNYYDGWNGGNSFRNF